MSSSRTITAKELERNDPLSVGTREYFRARLRNRLYDFIVSKYAAREKAGGLTQRALAARIRRRPEVINRLLAAPGNWTLDTVSDLLLGIGPEELDMNSTPVVGRAPRNSSGASALEDYQQRRAREAQRDDREDPASLSGPKVETPKSIDDLLREAALREAA
jgi:hypothetical protein